MARGSRPKPMVPTILLHFFINLLKLTFFSFEQRCFEVFYVKAVFGLVD